MATSLTPWSFKKGSPPVASFIRLSSGLCLGRLFVKSLTHKHYTKPTVTKIPRSSSLMGALYGARTKSSFSCLRFSACCFLYVSFRHLKSIKRFVDIPFNHGTSIKLIVVSLTESFFACALIFR